MTVRWTETARSELADFWLRADSVERRKIATAAHAVIGGCRSMLKAKANRVRTVDVLSLSRHSGFYFASSRMARRCKS